MKKKKEPHLEIYHNRSVLVFEDGSTQVFMEGSPDDETRQRLQHVKEQLSMGWLERVYSELPQAVDSLKVDSDTYELIQKIVDSITSETGRALVGITILQLVVKSLAPDQSIRLHKGGSGDFSWQKGFPLRSLDAQFITPFLRKYNLLKINKYGVFMTRSLAENYPYSHFYKASIRGAKSEWLKLVDKIEARAVDAKTALQYILALLRNRSESFMQMTEQAIDLTNEFLQSPLNYQTILECLLEHVNTSTYSARLLEVCMHAFLQVLEDEGRLSGHLLPLCQMRTANKKHRNIADIEIIADDDTQSVIEAWDAKYGKPYLRDELDELYEKLKDKPVLRAGFVVEREPDRRPEIVLRLQEIAEICQTEIYLFSLEEWVEFYLNQIEVGEQHKELIARNWFMAYIESLCQRRRDRAPIDEPADQWVSDWIRLLQARLEQT